MPVLIFFLVTAAVGGVAYGSDQRQKRIAEQETARRALRVLKQQVEALEAQLRDLDQRYGRMTHQYWELCQLYQQRSAELERLRAAMDAMGWAQAA